MSVLLDCSCNSRAMQSAVVILVILVSACRTPISEIIRPVTSCTSTAIADDGLDDRVAIQSALDSGCVVLGPGIYDVFTPSSPINSRRPYSMLTVSNASLSGSGATTVIRFSGDASGLDWWGVLLGSSSIVQDMTLDTSMLVGTSEQTHAIRVSGPASSPAVTNVSFNHPQRGLPGGDCIQIVGYPGSEVVGARIRRSTFSHCDRSAVAVHSGAHDLQITDSVFPDTGDVHLNFEGSGDTDTVLIARDSFKSSSSTQSDISVELDLVTNARITDSSIDGSGILVFDSHAVEIDHVHVTRTLFGSSAAVVEVTKNSSGVSLHDVVLERASTATPGPVVRALPHGSGTPSNLSIVDTVLIQHTSANVVSTVGVVGLTLTRVAVEYDGISKTNFGLDVVGSTAVRTDRVAVEACTFSGPLLAEVRVSGSYAGTGVVTLIGNVGTDATQGLRCENVTSGSKITGPMSITRATPWPVDVCGPIGFLTTL